MTPTRLALLALALSWGFAPFAQGQEAPTADPAVPPAAPAIPDAPGDDGSLPAPPMTDTTAGDEADADVAPPPLPVAPPPLPVTPPPLPEPEVPTIWIEEGGTQGGPYTTAELEERVTAGTLTADTLAWSEGMAGWTPAGDVAELAPLLAAQAAPASAAEPMQPAAAGDLATFIVGSWRQQGPMMLEGGTPGFADLVTEFRADGSYAAQGSVTTTVGGQQTAFQIASQGTYTAQAMDGARFSLTMSGTMQANSPFGSETIPVEDTSVYERVDQVTVRDAATGDLLTRSPG